MATSGIDQYALKQAALALQKAIDEFRPDSEEARMVVGFVNQKKLIDDAIHERITEPIERLPNASRALDGALQGYPTLESALYAFFDQLKGARFRKSSQELSASELRSR